jgi:hypothetical protein
LFEKCGERASRGKIAEASQDEGGVEAGPHLVALPAQTDLFIVVMRSALGYRPPAPETIIALPERPTMN